MTNEEKTALFNRLAWVGLALAGFCLFMASIAYLKGRFDVSSIPTKEAKLSPIKRSGGYGRREGEADASCYIQAKWSKQYPEVRALVNDRFLSQKECDWMYDFVAAQNDKDYAVDREKALEELGV